MQLEYHHCELRIRVFPLTVNHAALACREKPALLVTVMHDVQESCMLFKLPQRKIHASVFIEHWTSDPSLP